MVDSAIVDKEPDLLANGSRLANMVVTQSTKATSVARLPDAQAAGVDRIASFFRRVCATTSGIRTDVLLVSHAINSLPPFLDALQQIANVSGVLVKPKSAQADVMHRVSRLYRTEFISREICYSPQKMQHLLNDLTRGRDTILVDIGGYFCNVPAWKQRGILSNIVGIVEDTENGHQRYLRSALGDMPIVSVARSFMKRLEDWWIGRAIVFSAERQLRRIGETFHAKRISVFGFGKIGLSIADTLKRHGYDVSVYDSDPCKRLLARCMNYAIPDREQAIAQADVIFSATGNRALRLSDFGTKTNVCFVFAATSADDEFEIDFAQAMHADSEFWHFPRSPGRNFFANKGDAINFMDGSEIGQYAHVVQSAIVHGLDAILCREYTAGTISELRHEREQLISSAFVDEFEGVPSHSGLLVQRAE